MSFSLADKQKQAGQLRDRHQQLGSKRSGSNKKKNTNSSKSSSSQGKASHEYPTEFYCPISHCLMLEPVMDREGNTYERTSIEQWLSEHNTSPITRNSLNKNHLVVNRALVSLIELELKRSGDQAELEKRRNIDARLLGAAKFENKIVHEQTDECGRTERWVCNSCGHHSPGNLRNWGWTACESCMTMPVRDPIQAHIDLIEKLKKRLGRT